MDLGAVVLQLRQYAPVFAGNVAGAAEFAASSKDQVWLPLPAAYVIPTEEQAERNDEMQALRQTVDEGFGIVVVFDNSPDRRGQTSTLQYAPMRAAIFKAMLNWHMPTEIGFAPRGLEYGGGHLIDFDRARLFYQYDFTLETQIDESDGFQIDAPPLLQIAANSNPGDPFVPSAVFLDQAPE